MNLRDQRRFIRWNTKARAQSPRSEHVLESLHEFVNSFSRARGDCDTTRKTLRVSVRQLAIRQIIDLVENDQSLFAESVQLFDHSVDCFHLLIHARMAQIDNVNEQIGFANLLKRRLE